MKKETIRKILIISTIICALISYTVILYTETYNSAYIDGYSVGVSDTFTVMDSLYIIIPKDNKPIIPKKQPYKKFEDDMFIKNYLSTINKAYNP